MREKVIEVWIVVLTVLVLVVSCFQVRNYYRQIEINRAQIEINRAAVVVFGSLKEYLEAVRLNCPNTFLSLIRKHKIDERNLDEFLNKQSFKKRPLRIVLDEH